MNTTLKTILIILNGIVLVLAGLWVINDLPVIEPLIVIGGQLIALLVLLFEKKLPFLRVNKVSQSDVNVDVPTDDKSNISIENIQKNSKIKIKRRDVQ